MRIGIDIDDVITNTSEIMEEYIMKDKNSNKIKEHMVEIMKGNPKEPEIIKFGLENYLKIFKKVELKENAREVIQRLSNAGNEIYLITARGENAEFFKGSEKVTIDFLKNNSINYNKIIFNSINKAKLCKENSIDIMIDDSVSHCEDVKKAGIRSIVFTTNINKDIPTDIERVSSWKELEEKILN